VVLAVTFAACTRTSDVMRPETARPAPDAAGASAPPLSIDAATIVAWTDPAAIDQLARSCAFEPSGVRESEDGPGPLSCDLRYDQACVADPCFHEDREACRKDCTSTCTSCGKTCAGACESCKAGCSDDRCRRTCAESCGRCRQECVGARDRCATAQCREVYRTCRVALVTKWLASGCDAVCRRLTKCNADCSAGDCSEACQKSIPGVEACHANMMLCPEMASAYERYELDPKWKANRCDAACKQIWKCAEMECSKASGCGEDIKMFDRCAARVPAAAPCGIREAPLLCPEPEGS